MTYMFCYAHHFEQHIPMLQSRFVQLQMPRYGTDNHGMFKAAHSLTSVINMYVIC